MTATPRLHYRADGQSGAPAVVLGPSLGTALEMWDAQLPELTRHWRVIRFDLPGHGSSPAPPGPYTIGELATGVLGVLDELEVEHFAYCGLSLGGAIGSWLGLHAGHRLSSLVLCCTAAKFGEPAAWFDRARRVRDEGVGWLVEPSTGRWFTSSFPQQEPGETQRLLDMLRAAAPEGYAGCCEAIGTFDVRERLEQVAAPARVIAGDSDPATPVETLRELADGIPGADLAVVPDAAHLANVEQPAAVTSAIVEHLQRA